MKYLIIFCVFLGGCSANFRVGEPTRGIYDLKKTNYVQGEYSPITPYLNVFETPRTRKPKKKNRRKCNGQ